VRSSRRRRAGAGDKEGLRAAWSGALAVLRTGALRTPVTCGMDAARAECPARRGPRRCAMIKLDRVFKFYRTAGIVKIVLDHVSVLFETGYSYGLMGVNGAGKSTTMRLLAGIELPNSGRVRRTTRISWPLGFATGFHPAMTGRENVKFVARAYGADVRKVLDFVDEFSEIGDYIDVPIYTYSSGMMARLSFGLSMAIDFETYLVDEITAVGDLRFQQRCTEAFDARRKHADVIMVSHSMGTVKSYCDRGGVIVDGRIVMFPTVDGAIMAYNRLNR